MRTLAELTSTPEPAWPLVQGWLAAATNPVVVLPPDVEKRDAVLLAVQVTLRSSLGAIVHETGGLLVDDGWIRVLGSGHERLPRPLAEWNRGRSTRSFDAPPPFLLVADDVLGGFFALDGGGLGSGIGDVHYFAPDTLEWESLGFGYTDFLGWLADGDLEKFYETFRWPGWRHETRALAGSQAYSFYPFLSTGPMPVEERSRREVPIDELYRLHVGGPE